MTKISKHLSILVLVTLTFISFIIFGCGSKQSPTGGKEDTEKLKVLASLPAEFAEIDEQMIELTFSKIVDKTSFLKGIYMYPPIVNKKIEYDGNIVTLKFLEALKKDTNYYVTLTTRIKDIRGNPLERNQTLTYKHGQLQSNRISGKISYESSADDGLTVQLNLLTADSLWVFAKSITGNSYALEELNSMDYILKAYIDKNLNGRYDSGIEPYSETFLKDQKVLSYELNMAYADTVMPKIWSVRAVSNREYEIAFNKVIKTFQTIKAEDLKQKENLHIFTKNHTLDRITLLTAETDSSSYRFTVEGISDSKGNLNKTSSMTIAGSNKQDKIAPSVVSTNPRNGASVNNLQPLIEINFSEIIPIALFKASLKEIESSRDIPFKVIKSNHKTYTLQPDQPLANYKSCLLTIETTTSDLSGNTLAEPYKLAFLPILRDVEAKKPTQ